jgi:tetratricopeptide (TPR) repeat protein
MTTRLLGEAMELARSGRGEAAEALLSTILASDPTHPDALQLLGMVARSRKDHERAADLFRRSLAARPGQPHVMNNLGNALLDLKRPVEAIAAYRQALELQPDYWDALTNLGLAWLASGNPGEACETLGKLVAAQPANAKAWSALGRALRADDRLDDAIAAFRTSLAVRPNDIATLHNLGVALRLSGNAETALELLRRCAAASPGSAEIRYNLGHCEYDLGRLDAAAQAYEAAISLRPAYADAHDSLNRLYWQTGDPRYLASYAAVLRDNPGDTRLLADLANRLNLEGRTADTIALLEEALAQGADTAEIRHRLGQALWSQDSREHALGQFKQAIVADPEAATLRLELAGSLIILERYRDALDTLERVRLHKPHDQQAIALQGLAWRFLGDPRAGRLNDHDRFVQCFALQPHPEWGDAAAFNARLEEALVHLHNTSNHPLEQTLRGGTQTMGELFDRDAPEIQAVRVMIEDAVRAYIAALPSDADHVFLNRKSDGFRFSGSWSVRLRSQGFHLNHLHSEGWISSCYYVALPSAVEQERQGWITFGETNLGLGAREKIASAIRPEVGKLVLFPSYMYHGTIPFDDHGAFRTTIAFDVIPT